MLKTVKIPSQDVQLLQAMPMFASLSAKELGVVAAAAKHVTFPQGAVICEEGQSGIGLHVIVEGTVSITSTHSSPSSLGPGAYFGEIALIDRGPRLATVVAATDVTTLSIVAWEFTTLMDNHPEVTRALLLEMCGRLRAQAASYTH